MPFALASSANCLFHVSKPAAELPHCAASAFGLRHASAVRAAKVAAVSRPLLLISNSFQRHAFLSDDSRFPSPGTCTRAPQDMVVRSELFCIDLTNTVYLRS